SFTTPAHESKPTTHTTPAHDQASSSNDKGFDTYEGPDARVFTSDSKFKTRNFEKGDDISLGRFNKKGKNGILEDPSTGQKLQPDRARNSGAGGHGGSYWKLFDKKGARIGTISKDGKWLRG
ncbi:MAG: hypothetical protein KF820_08005, partial [Candidatus Paracaedibacteraceae bacterium]|nr:hypothetical protein [Candidatus Paracaedibacteraceae bacterium]